MNINAAHNQTLADFIADTLNGLYDDRSTAEVVVAVLDEFKANMREMR